VNKVRLLAMTQPEENTGIPDSSGIIAYCARVSNPDNQDNYETAPRLIDYLIKHAHWSPLEMVNLVFEIDCPRDIARQILRHRSFSYQEFSQRYAEATKLGMTTREFRLQDHKNRQNSVEMEDDELKQQWEAKQKQIQHEITMAYKWALENNMAKECARVILPEGMQMTRMTMNGTLRSWLHYLDLRQANGTQKEHTEIANLMKPIVCRKVPIVAKWLDKT
jgi:thymidylate synthase (FAD)